MIAFESEETMLRKLREELQQMSDAELIAFGKYGRSLAGRRVSGTGDTCQVKFDEGLIYPGLECIDINGIICHL